MLDNNESIQGLVTKSNFYSANLRVPPPIYFAERKSLGFRNVWLLSRFYVAVKLSLSYFGWLLRGRNAGDALSALSGTLPL